MRPLTSSFSPFGRSGCLTHTSDAHAHTIYGCACTLYCSLFVFFAILSLVVIKYADPSCVAATSGLLLTSVVAIKLSFQYVLVQGEKGEMPSRGEKVKETVVLSLLNIALPSLDVYSDFGLILEFYMGSRKNPWCDDNHYDYQGDIFSCYYDNSVPTLNVTFTPHYAWGTMMLLPFLLNYLICWYVWATTDKRKAVTWVAALLSFYPQYVALKIIYQIWWVNPTRGLRKKRQLERDLIQFEVFYEAVTSTLVMTYLAVRAGDGLPGSEIIVDWNNPASLNSVLFFVAFSTSIITSSLGLAKNLKVGPCRILPEQKRYLKGFLSPKFILIFFACGFTLVGKGIALANVVVGRGRAGRGPCGADLSGGVAIALSTFFLPGVLVSLFACLHCGILKTFLVHPSVFLLPVFTHFTFRSKRNFCCEGENVGESFISFSPMTTAVNAGVCIAGALAYLFTLPLVTTHPDWFCSTELFLKLGLLCTILASSSLWSPLSPTSATAAEPAAAPARPFAAASAATPAAASPSSLERSSLPRLT